MEHALVALFEGPTHICIVMGWGAHELDSQHILAAAVLEALWLLHEVVGEVGEVGEVPEHLHLPASELRTLMGRLRRADSHLQANLFIE